ncbi:glycosyltransferase family 2 protein [Roseospirillum parvum]|uniref:Dolichol-phosphate mannosyltransferase n=1 Tax=Roseospirillum parvum TaxID=83401 RepID=A0A1G7U4K1_9PROT|nr:glycosyltransferase family 2 protein [Roseospirillum parvum]SDG42191.1 dolichol-phosphate mannosyltransferase [Roseospirillum parvum]
MSPHPAPATPSSGAPELAVVVPVRNEADNIDSLIEEIHAALDGRLAFEVIYVDDGSDDATPQVLKQAKARWPRLRTARHAASAGQSKAILTGVQIARAPWIATLDGDGQNDPADIPALLEASRGQGAERAKVLIAGHRRKRRDTLVKQISSRIANRVRAGLLGDDTPDTGCGLKVFARATFLDLPRFDHMHRFLPALIIREGGRVVSVGVNHRHRTRGTSKYGTFDRLWVGLVDLAGVRWLMARARRPIVEDHD